MNLIYGIKTKQGNYDQFLENAKGAEHDTTGNFKQT